MSMCHVISRNTSILKPSSRLCQSERFYQSQAMEQKPPDTLTSGYMLGNVKYISPISVA